jgi:hypothetical protein
MCGVCVAGAADTAKGETWELLRLLDETCPADVRLEDTLTSFSSPAVGAEALRHCQTLATAGENLFALRHARRHLSTQLPRMSGARIAALCRSSPGSILIAQALVRAVVRAGPADPWPRPPGPSELAQVGLRSLAPKILEGAFRDADLKPRDVLDGPAWMVALCFLTRLNRPELVGAFVAGLVGEEGFAASSGGLMLLAHLLGAAPLRFGEEYLSENPSMELRAAARDAVVTSVGESKLSHQQFVAEVSKLEEGTFALEGLWRRRPPR